MGESLGVGVVGACCCEVFTTTGLVVVGGEITTKTYVDVTKIVRETLKEFSDIFEDKASILLNKVFPETDYWSNDKQRELCTQQPFPLPQQDKDLSPHLGKV